MINLANKMWDIDVIGILATDAYVYARTGKPAVIINSQNAVQFAVRIVSQVPYGFPSEEIFWAYTSDVERFGFSDDTTQPAEVRIQQFGQFVQNRVFVFQPFQKMKPDGTVVYQTRDLRMKAVEPDFTPDDPQYVSVPIFNARKDFDFEQFVGKLRNGQPLGTVARLSTDSSDTPTYVLWREEDDTYTIIGEFEKHQYKSIGGFVLQFDYLKISEFQEAWFSNAIIEGNICFITESLYRDIGEQFKLLLPQEAPSDSEKRDTRSHDSPLSGVPLTENASTDEEYAFINHFTQCTRDHALAYKEEDLVNFHTAMKSSNLVILAGMSGTGKSKLAVAYADALGLNHNEQLTMISVRPSWTDDADLIGYVDSIHNVYRPGDSGLINTLIHAAKDENDDKLYLICFDEMNLARVEHYFSQFLSVLEMSPNRRVLKLYNKELENRLHNSMVYPSSVPIKENVLFMGTVNLDESTHHFSDKVLDRSNVIKLGVSSFKSLMDLKERKPALKTYTFSTYQGFKSSSETVDFSEHEINFLDRLHKVFKDANEESGIGYRIVRQIDRYLKNLPQGRTLDRKKAFDLQILQRVMTKVRGSEEQLKSMLGIWNDKTNTVQQSALLELFDKYPSVSDFESTRRSVTHKAKELHLHGYTI